MSPVLRRAACRRSRTCAVRFNPPDGGAGAGGDGSGSRAKRAAWPGGSRLVAINGAAWGRFGFLLEVNREGKDLHDEMWKKRVRQLEGYLPAWKIDPQPHLRARAKTGESAHRFIYGGRTAAHGFAVGACSFPKWLLKEEDMPTALATFLELARLGTLRGFSWEQLKAYIAAMNFGTGSLGAEARQKFLDTTLSVGVHESGRMTADVLSSVLHRAAQHQLAPKQPELAGLEERIA